MNCNVGGTDRVLRTVLGFGFLAAGLTAPMDRTLRAALLVLAGIGLTTAATRYCPLNAALGFDTCNRRRLA
ncbi:DUF2892 domain-containing protein [Falsiroseomonas sp.]|uniref:YgaP family membrane protein n=1 Tax=Falsiroseomonas sp. TaxID=2870721 RepID=UPI00356474FE